MVADVSGKGVPAAMMMARASSEAKVGLASSPGDLGHAMNYINIAMCAAFPDDLSPWWFVSSTR